MYILLLVMWIYLLIILTCTKNFTSIMRGEPVQFQVTTEPTFGQFFDIAIYANPSLPFILQKAGHFICFFILALLLIQVCKNIQLSLVIGLLFAAGTELAQPFFYREGLFIDLMINSLGILSYTLLYYICDKWIAAVSITDETPKTRSRIV
ncbi:VanZ family protein [Alkalihalobacterium alkalinitrilicum]|uniref:VanZ family protein n=1 Tax=Alkalihalobacterium alkalinitrilicum TaxID=427920 RepID=UPI0009948E6D|nr:VanZ family protein [Alkalihalobacterium alkalinitrilicum]